MTRYKELAQQAEGWSEDELTARLRVAVRSDHFPALVGVLERAIEEFVSAVSAQKMSAHKGSIEHCAGSIYALRYLRARVGEACDPPAKRRRPEAPPPEPIEGRHD